MSTIREETIQILLKTIEAVLSPGSWEALFGEAAIAAAPFQAVQLTITPGRVLISVVDANSTVSNANLEMKKALNKLNKPTQPEARWAKWELKKHSVKGLLFYTAEYKDKVLTIEAIDTPSLDKYDGFVEGVKIASEGDFDSIEEILINHVDKMEE